MKTNHLTLFTLAISLLGHAQSRPPADKVNTLAVAISHAEGFGRHRTIPTRYHNPGDLKALPCSKRLDGQVRLGKGSHIVFESDEAGWSALREYISKMMDGRSRHFNPDMTLNQVARGYAQNWRPWVAIVSKELGVSPSTTLKAYFHEDTEELPALDLPLSAVDPSIDPPAMVIPAQFPVGLLESSVVVPPLVEEPTISPVHEGRVARVRHLLRRN